MEDWKALQTADTKEVVYTEKPSMEEVRGPLDQHEIAERKELNQSEMMEKGTKRLSQGPPPAHPRLSILDIEGQDWDEQDAVLRNAKEMAHTLMEKECAAEDVINVWEEISKYIIFKMMEGQAVRIAGLGTFTQRIHKMPVNQKTVKITRAPSFIISEHVAQMYRLKQDKLHTSNVPVVPLNLSVVANDMKMPRGMIEGIVTEVLQAFARAIVCNKSLEFPFPFIGKLQIRDQKVTMKFYDKFCNKLGFNMVASPAEEALYENLILGRMTPLKHHIPSDTFRSVFHLREVRSVHEGSLWVPLVKTGEKFIPVTLACAERNFRQRYEDRSILEPCVGSTIPTSDLAKPPCGKPKVCKPFGAPRNAGNTNLNLENNQTLRSKHRKYWMPEPLYAPKKTGDCVLDLMNDCPEVMNQCLKAHMYRVFIDTLGKDQVKSHFHRRGNHGPCRAFSYTELNPECPPSTVGSL